MKGDNLANETLRQAEGWEALDLAQADQFKGAELQQALLVAGHYQSTFCNSEQGRFVLKELVRDFMLPRVANPGDDAVTIGIRQGQADVVRRILAYIEFSQTGGSPP